MVQREHLHTGLEASSCVNYHFNSSTHDGDWIRGNAMTLDSELVNHFKVEAFVTPTYTIQEKTISDPAEGIPGTVKTEYWQVIRPIGAGAFGEVVLQQEGVGGQVRVVKSIARRRHGQSKDLDLRRELLAMASFAKVSLSPHEIAHDEMAINAWLGRTIHISSR